MTAEQTQAIQTALSHHIAGRVAEAEAIYRQVLQSHPNSPPALHLLGVACSQQGRKDQAIEYITRAITLNPNVPDFHSNLALVYLEKGDPDKAAIAAQRALALRPDHADALNHLGSTLRAMGKLEDSIGLFQRALAAKADHPDALANLADVYRRLGRNAEADAKLERLLTVRPDNVDALAARGEALLNQRKYQDAAATFRSLIQTHPNLWVGYNGLGVALFRQGRIAESIPLYRKAIELAPDNPGPYNNVGYASVIEGRIDEAIECFHKALALRPDFAEAHNNLGNAWLARLELAKAMEAYERALFFQPDNHDAHWNKSLLLLLRGNYPDGWHEYEWRWLKFPEQHRTFRQPLWDGFDLSGKTILLHAEQGFGDTIQFIRLAPQVAQRGATVNLECQRELVPLLQRFPGVARTFARGDAPPPFDVHCPLMTLPHALRMTVDSIPSSHTYIEPDASLARRWEQTLEPYCATLKVGLAWAGAAIHGRDRDRSAPPEPFEALAGINGVTFFSLQKGDSGRATPPEALKLVDLTAQLHDFAETAALVENLDLVISVDTAVAHLAGAMGKPVWTLLSFSPDWRWLLDREDSPWYPSMRLFRQTAPRDWDGLMRRVAQELRLTNGSKSQAPRVIERRLPSSEANRR